LAEAKRQASDSARAPLGWQRHPAPWAGVPAARNAPALSVRNSGADRPDDAKIHFEKALRLSPLDPINFNNYVGLASARQVVGDDNACADLLIRALQERPNAHWIYRNLAPALYGAGRLNEAYAARDALLAAYPKMTVRKFMEAMVF
jgi:adenylate cyclase